MTSNDQSFKCPLTFLTDHIIFQFYRKKQSRREQRADRSWKQTQNLLQKLGLADGSNLSKCRLASEYNPKEWATEYPYAKAYWYTTLDGRLEVSRVFNEKEMLRRALQDAPYDRDVLLDSEVKEGDEVSDLGLLAKASIECFGGMNVVMSRVSIFSFHLIERQDRFMTQTNCMFLIQQYPTGPVKRTVLNYLARLGTKDESARAIIMNMTQDLDVEHWNEKSKDAKTESPYRERIRTAPDPYAHSPSYDVCKPTATGEASRLQMSEDQSYERVDGFLGATPTSYFRFRNWEDGYTLTDADRARMVAMLSEVTDILLENWEEGDETQGQAVQKPSLTLLSHW